MKQNTPVQNTIRKSHSVKALPRLCAEFNWNRYSTPTADNTPPHTTVARDPDFYPAESMTRPNRPKKGHVKAQLDYSILSETYSPAPPPVRHHIAEVEDVYKYWSSPEPTKAGIMATNLAINPSFEKAQYTNTAERFRNLVKNPVPIINTATWNLAGNVSAISSSPLSVPAFVFRRRAGALAIVYTNDQSAFAVKGGQYYSLSALAMVYSGQTLSMDIQWLDSNGALISYSPRAFMYGPGTTVGAPVDNKFYPVPSGTPTWFNHSVIAPANATSGIVRIFRDAGADGDAYVTFIQVTRTRFALPYFDGGGANGLGLDHSISWAGTPYASETINVGPVADQEIIRNLVPDPQTKSGFGWSAQWYGTGGAGTDTVITDTVNLTPVGGTTFRRKRWTTAPTTSSDIGWSFRNSNTANDYFAVTPGEYVSASAYHRTSMPSTLVRINFSWYNASNVQVGTTVSGTPVTGTSTWNRVTGISPVAPAGATKVRVDLRIDRTPGLPVVNDTFDATGIMVTKSTAIPDFFDGTGASPGGYFDDPDFQFAWIGTANASQSVARGISVANTSRSTASFAIQSVREDKKWLRITTIGSSLDSYADVAQMMGGFVDGKTYTVMATSRQEGAITNSTGGNKPRAMWAISTGITPAISAQSTAGANAAGTTSHLMTVTVPPSTAGATYKGMRLINGGAVFGGDIWWDNLTVVEGIYDGPAFNGNTVGTSQINHAWTGTPSASTSIRTDALAFGPLNGASSSANPQVTYDRLVRTNKILVGLETSLNYPVIYEVSIKETMNGSWIKVADQDSAIIDADGRIALYYNGTSWTPTKTLAYNKQIAGIQFKAVKMNLSGFLNVIEIAAILEMDLTDYLTTVTDQFDLGDSNVLSPIGKISSNTATVTLFNGLVDEDDFTKGLMFNQGNLNSPLYGLMKENVKFTLDYLYDASAFSGSTTEPIRQFVMYAEQDWGADLQETVSVSLRDGSKFLQEIKCPETFYVANGKMTIGELIWRLLDNVGFLDYNIDQPDLDSPMAINYFWVKTDKYVWETLAELADATQTAIYFDSYGVLQIKTKEEAFKPTATPVWTIRGETSGLELEDLVADSLQNERKDISNTFTVNYRPVDFEKSSNDNFISQMVWQPEGDVTMLRSSDLASNFLANDTMFHIPQPEAASWPYSGMIQIEGEVIEYDGKEYGYFDDTDNGIFKTAIVRSLSDYQMYYWKTNTANQYRNYFSGLFVVKQRGMMNTNVRDHKIGAYPYEFKTVRGAGTADGVYGAYTTKPANQSAYLRLQSSIYTPADKYHTATRGSTGGDAPNFYGTRLRFPSTGQRDNCGGLLINATGPNLSGYYVEMKPSTNATAQWREVYVYVKDGNGALLQIGNWSANIARDVWYSLDVQLSRGDSDQDGGKGNSVHYIWVWLDGRLLGVCGVPTSWRRTNSDRFGMQLHASSAIDYDYLYAYERRDVGEEQFYGDDVSFYDRVLGGYYANQSLDDFTEKYRRARRRVGDKNEYFTQRYDTKFYDEFSPVVHEIRKYEVKFDESLPGLAPKLIATNESQAKYINFRSTAFSAEFYAINASHDDVNINGSYNGIDHSLGIAMQALKQSEGDKIVVENTSAIRAGGKKDLEITSDLIQSKDQATNIGEWIKNHWDDGTDEISVEIFGNPLLELTDIVYLDDPQTNRTMVKYFVIALGTSFDQGLSTTARLRKVRV